MSENYFDPDHLINHVQDQFYFEVPRFLDFDGPEGKPDGRLELPYWGESREPIAEIKVGNELVDDIIGPFRGQLTKFMVLELAAALIMTVLFVWLARKIAPGGRPRGRLWNLLEAMLLFIRDEVARPAIGKHDADRFLPFLWTLFFFILICNLLGLVPWAGSPTGALAVTGTLALITFGTVVGGGMAKLGVFKYWKAQVPHMELPFVLAIFLKPLILVIEVVGLCIKHFVLSVRLLANMVAGHVVLGVVVAFVAAAWLTPFIFVVAPASILGATAVCLLELFVAFLQAYIFTILSALFIGMAVHPH
jgi:F-type H+-transporting ATPase subunit a